MAKTVRTIVLLAVILLLVALEVSWASEFYRVTVTRVSQDLYKTDTGVYIKTRYCYEYAYGEEAILKWAGPGFAGSELIFVNSGGSKCDVDLILR